MFAAFNNFYTAFGKEYHHKNINISMYMYICLCMDV